MEDLNLPENTFDLTELLDKDLLISENETYEEYEDSEENIDLRENLTNEMKFFTVKMRIISDIESSETESDEERDDDIINKVQNKENLSPCVIIDMYEGKIQRCNSVTKLRRLWQMIGMWQIDEEEVKAKNFAIEHLGVCYSHFIHGANCEEHSYIVIGKNIQVPCIGQKKCGALQECHSLVISTTKK
ncbi:unnamed protein product [Rhizophagus irregularis]|nr:unnamed protein product [Rhizophagus irregularis]